MNIKNPIWIILCFVLLTSAFAADIDLSLGSGGVNESEWNPATADYTTPANIDKFFEQKTIDWTIVEGKDEFWNNLPADKISDAPQGSLAQYWDSLPDKSQITESKLYEVVYLKDTEQTSLDGIPSSTVGELLSSIRGTSDISISNEKGITLGITAFGTLSSEENSINLNSYSGNFDIEVGEDEVIRIVSPSDVADESDDETGDENGDETETGDDTTEPTTNTNQLIVDLTDYTTEKLATQSFTLEAPTGTSTPIKILVGDGITNPKQTLHVFPGSSLKFEDSTWKITSETDAIIGTTNNQDEAYFFKTEDKPITINGVGDNIVVFGIYEGKEVVTVRGSNFLMAYYDINEQTYDQDIILGDGIASVSVSGREHVTVNSLTHDIQISDYYVRANGRTVISATSQERNLPTTLTVNENVGTDSQRQFAQTYNFVAEAKQWSGEITSETFAKLNIGMDDTTSPLDIARQIQKHKTNNLFGVSKPTTAQLDQLMINLVGIDLTGIDTAQITKEILLKHPELVAAANRYPPGEGTGPQIIPTVDETDKDGNVIEELPGYVLAFTNDEGKTNHIFVQGKANGDEPGKTEIRAALFKLISTSDAESPSSVSSQKVTDELKKLTSYVTENNYPAYSSFTTNEKKAFNGVFIANLAHLVARGLPVSYDPQTDTFVITDKSQFQEIVNDLSAQEKETLYSRVARHMAIISSESSFNQNAIDGGTSGDSYRGIGQMGASEARSAKALLSDNYIDINLDLSSNPLTKLIGHSSAAAALLVAEQLHTDLELLAKYDGEVSEYTEDFIYNFGSETYKIFRERFAGDGVYTAKMEVQIAQALKSAYVDNEAYFKDKNNFKYKTSEDERRYFAERGIKILEFAKTYPQYADLFKNYGEIGDTWDEGSDMQGDNQQSDATKLYTAATRVNTQEKYASRFDLDLTSTTQSDQPSVAQLNEIAQNYGYTDFASLSPNLPDLSVNVPQYTQPEIEDYTQPFTIKNRNGESLTVKDYNNDGEIDSQDLINAGYILANKNLQESDVKYSEASDALSRFGYNMESLTQNPSNTIPKFTPQTGSIDYTKPFTLTNLNGVTLTINDYNGDGKIDNQELINAGYIGANGNLKGSHTEATNLLSQFGYSMETLVANRGGSIQPAAQNPARTGTPPASTGDLQTASKFSDVSQSDPERERTIQQNLNKKNGIVIKDRSGKTPAHCTGAAQIVCTGGILNEKESYGWDGISAAYGIKRKYANWAEHEGEGNEIADLDNRQTLQLQVGDHLQYMNYWTSSSGKLKISSHSAIIYKKQTYRITVNGLEYPAWEVENYGSSGNGDDWHHDTDYVTTAPTSNNGIVIDGKRYGGIRRVQPLPSDSPLLEPIN